MTADPVVIVGMARTPMGSFNGVLTDASGPELGAAAMPIQLPVGDGERFSGLVDLVDRRLLRWKGDGQRARGLLRRRGRRRI